MDLAAAAASAVPSATPATLTGPAETPRPRPKRLDFAAVTPATQPVEEPIVVTRASTSGGRHWGIHIGSYPSRFSAERVLLKTALNEMSTLDGALRKVSQGNGGYKANFVGLSREQADLACRKLEARGAECTPFGPSGS